MSLWYGNVKVKTMSRKNGDDVTCSYLLDANLGDALAIEQTERL